MITATIDMPNGISHAQSGTPPFFMVSPPSPFRVSRDILGKKYSIQFLRTQFKE